MATAPSLESEICSDVPRWYSAAVVLTVANVPLSLGHLCVTDLCIQRLFEEEYSLLVLGTDYTADLDAGTVTLLAALEGTAIAYFNVLTCETEPECKTAPCCPPDKYEYQSINGTDSETETNEGCVEIIVTVEPVSGSFVFFPTYVVLSADHDDAVIRYTTDGSDPDEFSDIYTAPFEITQAGTLIKASATVGDCSAGPITTVLYQNAPFEIGMVYSCDTPDNGGTWGVFVPNGNPDNHWQIEFTLPSLTTLKRFEMYQLSGTGEFTTGIVWATDSPINDGFAAMPLLVFAVGAQQWASYQTSLGAFPAATYLLDLYGDRQFAVSGFFRFDMILGDDSRISSVVDVECTVNPPVPCPSPAAPSAAGACDGEVTVTFANTIGQAFKIYVNEVLFNTGVTGANPQIETVTGLTPGVVYFFRVELEYAGCGFQSNISVQGVPLPEPSVSIASDKLIVDPNETFLISWSSTNIGGAVCGGCLDGEVSINQSMGCKAGNAAGSQSQSQATPGLYTYTITGCNACGTVVDSVQVEVRDVAFCSTQPAIITISNWLTFLCGFYTPLSGAGTCRPACFSSVASPGDIPLTGDCFWENLGMNGGCGEVSGGTTFYLPLHVTCEFVVDRWRLTMDGAGCGIDGPSIWEGEKLFGGSPLGVYTQTGGCATGPTTVTIT